MKKITRILSVALVAVMLLSVSAVALAAETPSVYIPTKLGKLCDVWLDDYVWPELEINITGVAKIKDEDGNYVYSSYCKDPGQPGGMAIAKGITEDSVAQYQFSEKPDWFGVVLSQLDGGWANIDIDDNGYGEFEIGELHRQPGVWIKQVMHCDEYEITLEDGTTQKVKDVYWAYPDWMFDGEGNWAIADIGDYPYSGGKDYGDYAADVWYHRDGSAYKVTITLKDSEDFFRTGQEGGLMKITAEFVEIPYTVKKGADKGKVKTTKDWYITNVTAVYPEGNYITEVYTQWRNDSKQNLASYKISYAVSEKETYRITYAPKTTTIYQYGPSWDKRFYDISNEGYCYGLEPSYKYGDGTYLTHYTADDPIYGEYYRDGKLVAVSGSGDSNIKKWYKYNGTDTNGKNGKTNNLGAQVRGIKKNIFSFKSPRVLTK